MSGFINDREKKKHISCEVFSLVDFWSNDDRFIVAVDIQAWVCFEFFGCCDYFDYKVSVEVKGRNRVET